MRSKPKAYAIGVVFLEVLCCILIYLCCVYIRRRRCGHKLRDVFWGSKASVGGGLKLGADSLVLVFFSYSALDAFNVIKTRGLRCTACLREFNKDDDTLRLMPKCGHVFHPLCLVDPCSVSCPCCNVVFGSDRPSLKSEGDENENEQPVAIDIDMHPEAKAQGKDKDSQIIEAEVEAETEAKAKNETVDEIETGDEIKSKTIVVSEGTVKAMDMIIEIGLLEEKDTTKLPEDIKEKIISQAKLVSPTGEVYSRSRYLW